MKINNNPFDHHRTDQLGRQLANQLQRQSLPHDVTERLRIARTQAVARARLLGMQAELQFKPRHASAIELSPARSGLSKFGSRMWLGFGSALPLLALVLGLFFLSGFHSQKWLTEISQIDSALLIDDLPPDAYTDSGFMAFLQSEQNSVKDETEESTESMQSK